MFINKYLFKYVTLAYCNGLIRLVQDKFSDSSVLPVLAKGVTPLPASHSPVGRGNHKCV